MDDDNYYSQANTSRRMGPPNIGTVIPPGAVQVRLMSDDVTALSAAAEKLADSGLIKMMGTSPNKRGPGARMYGVVR